jgi:hypothetical protein
MVSRNRKMSSAQSLPLWNLFGHSHLACPVEIQDIVVILEGIGNFYEEEKEIVFSLLLILLDVK